MFGFQSEKALYFAESALCAKNNFCGLHGSCLTNPNFVSDIVFPSHRSEGYYKYCACESGYSGESSNIFSGINSTNVVVYRAQSGSTEPDNHIEQIFDMDNANAAFLSGDGDYAWQ
jgi:hypothetical protein